MLLLENLITRSVESKSSHKESLSIIAHWTGGTLGAFRPEGGARSRSSDAFAFIGLMSAIWLQPKHCGGQCTHILLEIHYIFQSRECVYNCFCIALQYEIMSMSDFNDLMKRILRTFGHLHCSDVQNYDANICFSLPQRYGTRTNWEQKETGCQIGCRNLFQKSLPSLALRTVLVIRGSPKHLLSNSASKWKQTKFRKTYQS